MKKPVKIIIAIVGISLAITWLWWQQHKKGIIKDTIETAVSKGTDSLYYIQYDSSSIDEINGNASFFNVRLQSDSLQQQLTQFDTASSDAVYNIRIGQVSVKGANIPALLSNTMVEARSIEIIDPVVYIISSGKKKKEALGYYDTLSIYEKILGRYKSVQAGEIVIRNGNLFFTDKTGEPQTALRGIAVQLNNFRVDSTKDYSNIISYFIKDVVASVKEISVESTNHHNLFADVEYNAPGKFLSLKKFRQTDLSQKITLDINNTNITGISTDSFILRQQLKADQFKTDGGLVTLYRNKEKENAGDRIELENNAFDEALLNKINIGNTKLVIYNKSKPAEAPFILENARFSASDIQKLYSGTPIRQLISRSNWILAADGFSFISDDKIYKYVVGAFDLNNGNASMRIKNFSIKPQVTEEAFAKSLKFQKDLYHIDFNNIVLAGLDTKALITDKKILVQTLTLQPVIKVFNDRTVAPNPASKVGKYPQQQLQELKVPFSAGKVIVKDGSVFYKERGALSKQTGTVFFKNIQATITNVTNVSERVGKNNVMLLDATALFMDISKLHTNWKLPLRSANGAFQVSGEASGFNAEQLNPIAEPMGMASIKSGIVKKLAFTMTGDDYGAKGTTNLVYEDLKMEVLKRDSNELKKKGFMSFIANALVKNSNAEAKYPKPVAMNFQRDTTKSFFNLVWKTVFEGTKNTIQKLK